VRGNFTGCGSEMVLKPKLFFECVEEVRAQRTYEEVIFLTLEGELFTQKIAAHLKSDHHLRRNFYEGFAGDSLNVMCQGRGFANGSRSDELQTDDEHWQLFFDLAWKSLTNSWSPDLAH
jgi:hypothetical protein